LSETLKIAKTKTLIFFSNLASKVEFQFSSCHKFN
jgi:hypothetical protein